MLKKTVSYTDFNDNPREETLYFNISKSQLADNLDLKEQIEDIEKMFQGPKRTLETSEVRKILELVKRLVKMAYGIRSEDGQHFRKNEEIWDNFADTAAYDAFLFSLFENPDEAFSFVIAILPKDLREQAEVLANKDQTQLPMTPESSDEIPQDTRPAWVRENREPNSLEIREMDPETLREMFVQKSQVKP